MFALLSLVALSTGIVDNGDLQTERMALLIAHSDGGVERTRLRFAERDAERMAEVLAGLGGVERAAQWRLVDPSVADVEEAFREIRQRAQQGGRKEIIVYYSGHSDDSGLLLGDEHLPYRQLRAFIDDVPADVRIAMLDSCAAGAFARSKGGVRKPTFLVDSALDVSGYAFLMSSSADEAAQEADRIEASFFTHHLVSALRGAADVDGDGRVTLTEAYRYAYDTTLAATDRTALGRQHPSYDIELTGAGELVLTQIDEANATLVLTDDSHGAYLLRNHEDRVVVEIKKRRGQPLAVAMAPGSYIVTRSRNGQTTRAAFVLSSGRNLALDELEYESVPLEETVGRGSEQSVTQDAPSSDFFGIGQYDRPTVAMSQFAASICLRFIPLPFANLFSPIIVAAIGDTTGKTRGGIVPTALAALASFCLCGAPSFTLLVASLIPVFVQLVTMPLRVGSPSSERVNDEATLLIGSSVSSFSMIGAATLLLMVVEPLVSAGAMTAAYQFTAVDKAADDDEFKLPGLFPPEVQERNDDTTASTSKIVEDDRLAVRY